MPITKLELSRYDNGTYYTELTQQSPKFLIWLCSKMMHQSPDQESELKIRAHPFLAGFDPLRSYIRIEFRTKEIDYVNQYLNLLNEEKEKLGL